MNMLRYYLGEYLRVLGRVFLLVGAIAALAVVIVLLISLHPLWLSVTSLVLLAILLVSASMVWADHSEF